MERLAEVLMKLEEKGDYKKDEEKGDQHLDSIPSA
jgi:hypothetical protein